MKHEAFREMLALRLYGELEPDEQARLDQHLRMCADCRSFASELESGLGSLRAVRVERASDELPADWRERLRRSTIDEPRRARLSPWWSSAAAFAAGILVATILARRGGALAPRGEGSAGGLVARNDGARELSIYARFNGATPPPLASTEGQLARLGEYWKQ